MTLTTLPPPCGMKALVAAAWVICQVPWTLSSITVRKPFGVIASAGLRNWPPALLTSTSSRPWRSSTPSMSASTASSSRMSSGSCLGRPPRRLDLGHGLGERLGAAPAADHRRRPGAPARARSRAQPGAGARDHADLALEQAGGEDPRAAAARPSARRSIAATLAPPMRVHAQTEPLARPLAGRRARARPWSVEPLIGGRGPVPARATSSARAAGSNRCGARDRRPALEMALRARSRRS